MEGKDGWEDGVKERREREGEVAIYFSPHCL